MPSPSILERFTSPRNRSPILPLHSPPKRSPSEYDLDELDPRPDETLLRDDPLREAEPSASLRKSHAASIARRRSPASWDWNERDSSVGSSSRTRRRAMFPGPPPPIASSMMLPAESRIPTRKGKRATFRDSLGSESVQTTKESVPQSANSTWRSLRRRERALEGDVQLLLNIQAAGLVAGIGAGAQPSESDFDEASETGSNTATGTFYSTATSKSRMMTSSLYTPTRAKPDGTVIPVRQPKGSRPPGLRSARTGIRKSILALANLKAEEDAYVDAALAEREEALVQLDKLSSQNDSIRTELQTLEDDKEEPLGMELRELGEQHDSLTEEIRQLEERLVGMRNRRRLVRAKMDDVRNRREAGLSGYRGALKDVEAEMKAFMRHPPVNPLDLAVEDHQEGKQGTEIPSAGGLEFMRLIPERRTVEMARSWWQAEVSMLVRRKAQVDAERQALEEGGSAWREVMDAVATFESRLRLAMKGVSSSASTSTSTKGKEAEPLQGEIIRSELVEMDKVIAQLENHMRAAEEKGWNLLICAIGAELEAFKEAQGMLKGAVDGLEDPGVTEEVHEHWESARPEYPPEAKEGGEHRDGDEESDNEVPPDLLAPQDTERASSSSPEAQRGHRRNESDSDGPPDFREKSAGVKED